MPWYAELNKKVFFFFEKLGVRDQSNVNGRQAIPRFWCSDGERPLWWDQSRTQKTRSRLPAERREARPGMLATGVTNSVRYDGARPLTAWCTKRQSFRCLPLVREDNGKWTFWCLSLRCSSHSWRPYRGILNMYTRYINILCAGYHISDLNADIKNNNENIMRILTEMGVVNSATRASKFGWYSNGCMS